MSNLYCEPFEVFKAYCAVKAHFQGGRYNFFDNGGNIKCKNSTFESRNDRKMFIKLASKYSLKNCIKLFACNCAYNNTFWVGECFDEELIGHYNHHRKIMASFDYFVKSDIKYLEEKYGFIESMKANGQLPDVLYATVNGKINFESFTIFFNAFKLDKFWKDLDPYIYPKLKIRSEAFYPFLNADTKEVFRYIKQKEYKQ